MIPNAVAMKTNNPDEVRYCCTNCADEGFHLYFNLRKNLFHCFKCGYRGKSQPEVCYSDDRLEEMIKILQGEVKLEEAQHHVILPKSDPLWEHSRAQKYLASRGIPFPKATAMGCRVSDDPGYEWRVIIPMYSPLDGKMTFFQARGLLNSVKPKYLNPILSKSGTVFYNMGRICKRMCGHIYIVEGVFKALRFWEIGKPAVAILGKEITQEQIEVVRYLSMDVTVALDPDAFNFALRMQDQLEVAGGFNRVAVLNLPKAPDDLSAGELEARL